MHTKHLDGCEDCGTLFQGLIVAGLSLVVVDVLLTDTQHTTTVTLMMLLMVGKDRFMPVCIKKCS